MKVNADKCGVACTEILQHIFFCIQQKKVIQIWQHVWVSKWWLNCHFRVNYPFKVILKWQNYLSIHSVWNIRFHLNQAFYYKSSCAFSINHKRCFTVFEVRWWPHWSKDSLQILMKVNTWWFHFFVTGKNRSSFLFVYSWRTLK